MGLFDWNKSDDADDDKPDWFSGSEFTQWLDDGKDPETWKPTDSDKE